MKINHIPKSGFKLLLLLGFFLLLLPNRYLEAKGSSVYIDAIVISGNKHTDEKVILRELPFKKGDTISVTDIAKSLDEGEQLLMNTALFSRVLVNLKNWIAHSNKVTIEVSVSEAWYLYPIPEFELADRNFNVWWVEEDHSLKRVTYGLELTHLNLTGHKDRAQFHFNTGYTKLFSLQYIFPYINKSQKLGLDIYFSAEKNHEVNYITSGNKQLYFKDETKFIYQRRNAEIGWTYRPDIRLQHRFALAFNHKIIDKRIPQEYNSLFFANGDTDEYSFSASYWVKYDKRDNYAYPLDGYFWEAKLTKGGLGVWKDRNFLILALGYRRYFKPYERISLGIEARFKSQLIRNKPLSYQDTRAMGFSGTTLHGYEYYLVDGMDMGFLKTHVSYKILDNTMKFGKIMPIKAFRTVPVKVYLKWNTDTGYVNDPYDSGLNPLNQKLLLGYGPGVDFVFMYDVLLGFQYSRNHLGEGGFFVNISSSL